MTTWAAYNKWGGGYNVYGGGYTGYKGAGDYNQRSRKASFDRPYDKNGSYFNWYELPALSLAEQLGIPLAYETDLELSTSPGLFQGARSLFFAGHDEYWTSGMRDNTLRIRGAGTNIALLSSNTAYRHIRLENSSVGRNRVVVVYKNAAEDPMTLTNPAEATQQWRLPPDPRPESSLTGVYYECNPVYGDFVVTDPHAWMFAGTGVKAGQHFPGLVNVETDRLTAGVPVPRPIQVVSQSPVTCQIPGAPVKTHSNAAYYTVPSGAGVFATGTMGWSCSLGGATGCRGNSVKAKRVPAVSGDFARLVTANVLRVFQQGPAGRVHPAVDNYRRYVSPPSRLTYTN
ncbi:N,N-dimethylformamidase beta subunit family domain-containing protein [Streptacidiphilus monticola]